MNIKNKSILFVSDNINEFSITHNNYSKVGTSYKNIMERLYNDGYRTFFMGVNGSINSIALKSLLEVKWEHQDIILVTVVACDVLFSEIIDEENGIAIIKEPFAEHGFISYYCDKMVITTTDEKNLGDGTILYKIEGAEKQLLICETAIINTKTDKIKKVIEWSDLTVSQFAYDIDAWNEFDIFHMNNKFDRCGIAMLIHDLFPEINPMWLCYNENDPNDTYCCCGSICDYYGNYYDKSQMFCTKEEIAKNIYNYAARLLLTRDRSKNFNFAEYNDTLFPYLYNDIIFLFEKTEVVEYSDNYLYYVETHDFKGVRYVHFRSNDKIILKSELRKDDITVSIAEIKKLYRYYGIAKELPLKCKLFAKGSNKRRGKGFGCCMWLIGFMF